MSIEPKDCPKCGSSNVYGLVDPHKDDKAWCVKCGDCGLTSQKTYYAINAYKKWNDPDADVGRDRPKSKMSKWTVRLSLDGAVTLEVEADNEEDAKQNARDKFVDFSQEEILGCIEIFEEDVHEEG